MRSTVAGARPARVDGAGWGWRHAGRVRWAVDRLDLHLEPGERVLLLGPSGSGKSTVLHALAGVLGGHDEGESRGSLLVDGAPPAHARGRAGLVLQDPDAHVIMSRVGDDVAFGCENLGVPRDEIWRRVSAALNSVGLDVPLDHPTAHLSGGQKQRMALAGSLAMQPGLLLLDEPTANLDPEGVAEVRDAVRRVLDATRATCLIVEHRVDVWIDLVHRVVVLDRDGRLIADGDPARVLATHRDALLDAGVWAPGAPLPPLRSAAAGSIAAAGAPAAASATRLDIRRADAALRTIDLSIGRRHGATVREDLDVEIPEGASTVLTGPNGVGKSTFALTVGGLLPPLDGRVVASARLAAGCRHGPVEWRSRDLLTRIGTVFQEPDHQFVTSSVRDEVALAPRTLRLAPDEVDRRVDHVLERLRLAPLARANPFTLSGGEKRRLSVASVLVAEPSVIILDEPTFGQDRVTWLELVATLRELVDAGTTLLSVTHDAAYRDVLGDHRLEFAKEPIGGRR